VNGSLETELSLLQQLSQQEASEYLYENKNGIEEAQKKLNEKKSFDFGYYSTNTK